MEYRPVPEVFYGSAIAALSGLMFGLMLHAAWEKRPGGPQILSSAAHAATVASATPEDAPTVGPQSVDLADLDTGPVPPSPLPVTRLHPEMFDVQPASTGEAEREDVDDLLVDAPPPAPRQYRLIPESISP